LSRSSDFSSEMPHEDDAFPAQFAEEVRFAVSGPPPLPSSALAAVLAGGLCTNPTEKGDLLVTAASNVHGPAPQAAGLPKNWRNEREMSVSGGVLSGLLAKVAGIGTAAKAALATATAVTTIGLAGAAAGVLPGPAQTLVATAVNAATPFQLPGADGATGAVQQATGPLPHVDLPAVTVPSLPAAPPVSVAASAKAGSSTGSAGANASPSPAAAPALPNVGGLPSLPSLPGVPAAVAGPVKNLPACVTNLVPAAGSVPDPAKLATHIQACIPQVLAAPNLPTDVAKCVASVLGSIGGASGMSAGSLPSIGSLNVSACVPLDATKCVSNAMAAVGDLPGLPGGVPGIGSLPGLSTIPGLGNVAGCVPMDVSKCITSIAGALSSLPASGGAPKLDLSACMPTGVAGGAIPGLSGLPGLSGALPFFGK
jgi:hypothetical protein